MLACSSPSRRTEYDMDHTLAIMSRELWGMRRTVEAACQCQSVYWNGWVRRSSCDAIVGWGRKPSAQRAMRIARKRRKTFVSLEDGWLRSIEPGPKQAPLSILVDRIGVHYDATQPSELEALIAARAASDTPGERKRARDAIDRVRRHRLSKYNHAPILAPAAVGLGRSSGRPRVLVVDQTYRDCSIAYGLANDGSFEAMLDAAIDENPGAEIIVKTHPEVVQGRKSGYLTNVRRPGVRLVSQPVNPWVLIENVDKVYAVTSQLGFEALMAGREVVCFGMPFYAGWGLTDDRVSLPRRTARPALEQLFAALYFDYARYVLPDRLERVEFEQAVDWLLKERDDYSRNLLSNFPISRLPRAIAHHHRGPGVG